ncbi:Conserved_hypothetical protein [Hexamita inflata]|uniref:Leucine rich repeat protein n=1 Tax=Hexamita inflata TaxID=28002 RepID=A0AA86N6A3_9EUKA|nr:Conserved hypothetical protein [Hexamita inflata]
MNINQLSIQNCSNFKLRLTQEYIYFQDKYPETILLRPSSMILLLLTSLTINKCALTNVLGFELMKQLINLDLADNAIVSIQELQYLENLKQVKLDHNFVQDLEYLSNLPNLNLLSQKIYQQRYPNDNHLINFLKDTNSLMHLQDFKIYLASKKEKTDHMKNQFHKFNSLLLKEEQTPNTDHKEEFNQKFIKKVARKIKQDILQDLQDNIFNLITDQSEQEYEDITQRYVQIDEPIYKRQQEKYDNESPYVGYKRGNHKKINKYYDD